MVDNTPPKIENVDVVYPNDTYASRGDTLKIYADVSDYGSGLKDVLVNASSIGDGTRIPMMYNATSGHY